MVAPKITRYLGKIAWGLLVPLGVVVAYIGVGLALMMVVGQPILGTVLLGGGMATLIGTVRLVRPSWLAHAPTPRSKADIRVFDRTVVGSAVLAFLTGQSLALWLYAVAGSAGFDASVRARQDVGAVLTLLLVLVAAPVSEEALFRGVLYPLLRRRVGIGTSLLVTSAVFGLVHGNVVQFASAVPLAATLALLYERTRRLWPCIVVHLCFNLAAVCVPPWALMGLANPVSVLLLTAAFVCCALILYRRVVDELAATAADGRRDAGVQERDETSEHRPA